MNRSKVYMTALWAACLVMTASVARADYPSTAYPSAHRGPSTIDRVASNPAYSRYRGTSSAMLPLPTRLNLPTQPSVSATAPQYAPEHGVTVNYNQPTPPQLPVPEGYQPLDESQASPSDLPPRNVQIEQLDGSGNIVSSLDGSYAGCDICGQLDCGCRGPRFYGGVYALYMNRDRSDQYTFSYGTAQENLQYNDQRDASMDFSGGVEARIGYVFGGCDPCGGLFGAELVYWGLYPGAEETSVNYYDVYGDLNSILNFDDLDIGYGGPNAADWAYDSEIQRVRRTFEIQNVELNLLRFSGNCGGCFDGCCGKRLNYSVGVGARYFRFGETLNFAAKQYGYGPYFDYSAYQLNYDIDVDNQLFGGQFTGSGSYCITPRLSALFGAKLGLFANSITHQSVIYAGNEVAYVNNGPNAGQAWSVATSKTDMSMMAEINLGLSYRITKHIGISAGYRVLGVSGLALPSDQIYPDLRGLEDVRITDSNGSLLLHGAYFGLDFVF